MSNPPSKTCFAIYKISKLSGTNWPARKQALIGHNGRLAPTPNANPSIPPKIIHGPPFDKVASACQLLIDSHRHPAGHKLRRNAVVAVEHVLSTTREYFLNANGSFDRAKIQAWVKASRNWLRQQYGQTLVSAVLHLDERTPHIHAITVPLIDGVLSATKLYGKKQLLRNLQTSYGKALAPLGISRGIAGSRLSYTRRDKFYSLIEAADVPKIDLPPAEVTGATPSLFANPLPYVEQAVASQQERDLDEMQKIIEPYKAKAIHYDVLLSEHHRLKTQLSQLAPQTKECLPLEIMKTLGQKPSSAHSFETRWGRIRIRSMEWSSINRRTGEQRKGIGAISLVKHLFSCATEMAAAWIRDTFGVHQAEQSLAAHMNRIAKRRMRDIPAYSYAPPAKLTKPHLATDHLGKHTIMPNLFHKAEAMGQAYIAEQGELAFLRKDSNSVVGSEILSEGRDDPTLDIGAPHTKGFFRVPESTSQTNKGIAVCSSAISALAYQELFSRPAISILGCIHDEGDLSPELLDELEQYLHAGKTIHIALDNTPEDRRFALRLKRALEARQDRLLDPKIHIQHPGSKPTKHSPQPTVSWHDFLKKRSSSDRSPGGPSLEAGPR